jgi:predicted nucleic acid-binding protein
MRVLIDTNILLDVLLDRPPWAVEASAIWGACDAGHATGYISASTLTDIFYIARRATDVPTARLAVGLCLNTFEICAVDRQTLEQAALLPGGDFEDNVQIACALIAGLDAIVTRNSADFVAAPIPILTPTELLVRLRPQP